MPSKRPLEEEDSLSESSDIEDRRPSSATPAAPTPALSKPTVEPAPKTKRVATEAQLAGLAKGRAIRDEQRAQRKRTREEEVNAKKELADARDQLHVKRRETLKKLIHESLNETKVLEKKAAKTPVTDALVEKKKPKKRKASVGVSQGAHTFIYVTCVERRSHQGTIR